MNNSNKTQEKKLTTTKPKHRPKHHKKINNKSSTPFISQEKEINMESKNSKDLMIEEHKETSIKEINQENSTSKEDLILSLSSNDSKIKSDKEKRKYSYEYLQLFENMEKSKETDLLPEEVLDHINQIEDNLRSMKMENLLKINTLVNNSGNNCNSSKSSCSSFSTKMSLETWGRQDYTKETEEAENNKRNFEEFGKKDVIKKELRELLNIMTKDNFEEIKIKILEIIKDKTENQDKILDIIFIKALLEKSYVAIYSQLCKELNKKLPQKIKKKSNNNSNNDTNNNTKKKKEKSSSIFREKLLDKCKNILKFEENKYIEEFIKEGNEQEKNIKIKKIILGDALFISELINIKMLSKKAACDCIDYLFKKYNERQNNKNKMQLINIEAIIIFVDKLGSLMQKEKEPNKEKRIKENLYIKEKIKETFEKLEKIKDEEIIPGHIKYLIINLIKKRENNYKQSEFEKYITAKSKKEIEEIKETSQEKTENNEIKEITQEEINKLIEKDLSQYKEAILSEGNSANYLWEITTDLYDLKLKGFDSILEGYFICAGDFIEKKGNLQYAKDYIKELVEYYHEKMETKEKDDLLNKIVDLFEVVKDFSFETPDIYVLYEYVLEIFIQNDIIKIKDFENLFIKKENYKDDKNTICKIFKNVFDNISKDVYEKEFKELKFLNELIHW